MKLSVQFNDKTKQITYEPASDPLDLRDLTQRICIQFSITSFSDYALTTSTNGTLIERSNLFLVTDGCHLILKPRSTIPQPATGQSVPTLGSSSVAPSATTPTPKPAPMPSAVPTPAPSVTTPKPAPTPSPAPAPAPAPVHTSTSPSPMPTSPQSHTTSPGVTGATSPNPMSTSGSTPTSPGAQQQTTSPMPITFTSVESALSSLNDLSLKKKALFHLKDLLKDETSTRRFLEKDGIRLIEEQMNDLTGNTMAYALIAIHSACQYDFATVSLPMTLVKRLLVMIADPNLIPSITKTCLSILTQYCTAKPNGQRELFDQYLKLTPATSGQYQTLYANILALLSSSTVDIQLNALALINGTLAKSQSDELITVFSKLDELDINTKLRRLYESNVSHELKKQLYVYQKHKLSLIKQRKNVSYSKESQDHEALLMKLWTTTFPSVKLESRVSEQWKILGFQGTDPATDFRGMGVFGLDNLIYIAENHTEQFRKLISSQVERKERDYPVAVAGINLTQMHVL
ncbi:hypothetical protein SAMD00019534_083360 [Acytostelium subglobosum LB1]|uniref:hypothetical protein n=1 Tax=Acytostelium subglobosum LB1 TaxID=1410327 RepID=UPI000644CF9D|nr:hypothetical protein SAMD00019534_083360 [Acytostelium subglobosum LB1]GAM25161.1 hypothetical protein SAMD00019534_083360 [Acytostelium subglobosum LB1]|eukprot:XP_012751681.1 hypothetical protein SAMD00019534_083360 [Acytostelium subglobosum LB1]